MPQHILIFNKPFKFALVPIFLRTLCHYGIKAHVRNEKANKDILTVSFL